MKNSLVRILCLFLVCFYTVNVKAGDVKNYIKLITGKNVKMDSVHKFDEHKVHYIKDGSVHDIPILDVRYVAWNGMIITFDATNNNKPIYKKTYQPVIAKSTNTSETKLIAQSLNLGQDQSNATVLFVRPLALLEGYGKVLVGVNSRMNSKTYWKNSFGLIVHDYGSNEHLFYGIEARTEIKHVISTRNYRNRLGETYVGVNGGYKHVSVMHSEWVTVQSLDEDGYVIWDSYQTPSTQKNRFVGMANFKIGWQTFYKSGFFIDTYLGMGARVGPETRGFYFKTRPNLTAGIDLGFTI